MERLTLPHYGENGHYMKCSERFGCDGNCGDCDELGRLVERLAYYEGMEERGRLVILPVPIGSDFRRMDYPESLALRRNVRPAIQTSGIEWHGGYVVEGFMPLHVFEEYLKSGTIVAVEGGAAK